VMCTGPECDEPAARGGLCWGHVRDRQRHPDRPLRPLRKDWVKGAAIPKGKAPLTPQEQFDNAVAAFAMLKPSDKEAWRRAKKRVREASIRLFLFEGEALRERAWARLQETIFQLYEVPSEDDERAKRVQQRLKKRALQYGAAMRRTPSPRRTLRSRPG
jgi:hypothetical protein